MPDNPEIPSPDAFRQALSLPSYADLSVEQIDDAAVVRVTLPMETITLALPFEWFIHPDYVKIQAAVGKFRVALASSIGQ